MYNVILTGHGLVMVFFFMMPFAASGVANLLVALLLGANDLAFPRLNQLSFWLFQRLQTSISAVRTTPEPMLAAANM